MDCSEIWGYELSETVQILSETVQILSETVQILSETVQIPTPKPYDKTHSMIQNGDLTSTKCMHTVKPV